LKIGVHLSTYTKNWNDDVFKYLEISKKIGYDGVEIPLVDPFNFDIKKFKEELTRLNLEVSCGTGLSIDADISSVDSEKREKGLKHLKRCVDICNGLGSKVLGGVLYSPWGKLISREEAKENIEHSIKGLKEIAEYGEEKEVLISLEVLNRYESYFLNTVEEGKELLEKIGHKNVKLHFDTFHSHIEETSLRNAILSGASEIGHVHFCENNRGVPGTGQIDWNEVSKSLKDINYNGWIVVENFVMPSCEVGNTVGIWRKIDDSGEQAARKAYKFIDELIKGE